MLPESDKEYLLQYHSIFRDRTEAETYLYDSWNRIQVVVDWMEDLQTDGVKKVLELGANPYYLTILLRKHLNLDLKLANYFGESGHAPFEKQTYANGFEQQEFEYSHFNVETDRFPFEDQSFDCVIFCEILEHLLLQPDFSMSEIRRVLAPSGYVIISTPNASRISNLVRLARGKNIYAGYSPNGIYGRHNREYTFDEVVELLQRHGFALVRSDVRNIYPHKRIARVLQRLRPQTWYEHIFAMGKKS